MLPSDPYNQQNDTTDDLTYFGNAAPPPHYGPQGNAPLPLPYDDTDPTYQAPPTYQTPNYQNGPSFPYAQTEQANLPVPYRQPPPPARPSRPSRNAQPYLQPYPQQIVVVPQKRRSWFSVTCSVLLILLLMFCGLVGIGIYQGVINAGHSLGTAVTSAPAYITLAVFCEAEKAQAYSAAYQQFSTNLQQQITEDSFTKKSQQLDTQNGPVTSCDHPSNSSGAVNGSTVTALVDVTRTFPDDTGGAKAGKNSITEGTIMLVLEGGNWHIDHIDTALGLM